MSVKWIVASAPYCLVDDAELPLTATPIGPRKAAVMIEPCLDRRHTTNLVHILPTSLPAGCLGSLSESWPDTATVVPSCLTRASSGVLPIGSMRALAVIGFSVSDRRALHTPVGRYHPLNVGFKTRALYVGACRGTGIFWDC